MHLFVSAVGFYASALFLVGEFSVESYQGCMWHSLGGASSATGYVVHF